MNKHVGNVIPGNHSKVSPGGELVRDFIASGKYVLINSLPCVTGGPFTRFEPNDPSDSNRKSALDLVIGSKTLVNYIEKVVIDSEQVITPFRSKAKTRALTFPDHYAVVITFNNIPKSKRTVKNGVRKTVWNMKKKGGWEVYFRETDHNKVLDHISHTQTTDMNVISKKVNRELDNIKYKAFGKCSIK